jgi:nitrite reductase/ring-hydroxylating ferredoxin subunit
MATVEHPVGSATRTSLPTDLAALVAFGSDLIPRERFTSVDFLALEYERLWPRVWQVACRVEEIPEPGDFVEYVIGDRSSFVVRTGAGEVRAFHNTCIHRGTALASGCGRFRGEIRCPFHGWRWDLDGNSTFVLDAHEFPAEPAADLRLRDVRCETYGGFVFVNFDPDAPSLVGWLEEIPGYFDPYRPERMCFTSHKTTVLPANWKVVVDAFNEGYHIATTHPEILRWKDEAALEYTPLRTHTRYGGAGWPMPSRRLGIPTDEVDEQELLAFKIDDLIDNLPGYIGPAEAEALRAVARTPLPEGTTAGDFYLKRRRDGAAARGLDWSHLDDDQVLGGDDLLLFPNFIGPVIAGAFFGYRVRPNGMDPHSCIFELWTLEERAEGQPHTMCEREVYPDWRTHDWGLVVQQDFENFEGIQRGLRNAAGGGLRWNRRQESCVRRFHEVLDRYLFDAPT